MIELQKFIDELEAEKEKVRERFEHFQRRGNLLMTNYFEGMLETFSFTVTKARLLLKKTREQQP